MELDLEPRVKPLAYKVKATSRESTLQKAVNVLESDLKTHWSTGTNTKEWILLELDEPCLISHLRIYNKSVLEWEIAAGLRYKPETFVKVRSRCEAPRRDMVYPMNYTPCRYVRISCLRGNPIAVFFIQLIGVSVVGLEPEFQPVVNYLLPEIISHKQDTYDVYLQMLQDVTKRLVIFLPQLETDLINFSEAAESNMRFLAMLVGPLYPILHVLKEREAENVLFPSDSDTLRNKQTSNMTISSNFQALPKRSRSPPPLIEPASCTIAFRLDVVFALLRKAHKDSNLRTVCLIVSRALHKLIEPNSFAENPKLADDLTVAPEIDDEAKSDSLSHLVLSDYSSLYGDEFKIPDDSWDTSYLNILDVSSVEEAVLHVLYACVSQPRLCCKLNDNNSDFLSMLPLVQALLPALRPTVGSCSDQVDDSFSHWSSPFVQHALSQIIACSSSAVFHSLLRASAGYLASYSPTHVKAACVLIDLCVGGPLSSWIPTIIAKIDLAIDLLEDLLGMIQSASRDVARACAALKYIVLALSGHMDEILPKYKALKHKLLFLVEMLDPFLDPAVTATKTTISFGYVSTVFPEKQEQICAIALNIIRSAMQRPAVLASLESEWRQGSVAPSVLLSILDPHMPLPSNIDHYKCHFPRCNSESDGKHDSTEIVANTGIYEEANAFFAPPELKNMSLITANVETTTSENGSVDSEKLPREKIPIDQVQKMLNLNSPVFPVDYTNYQSDYFQLVNLEDCEARASEFQRLSLDLHSCNDITPECHEAAIDALFLAVECYINPFFCISFGSSPVVFVEGKTHDSVTKTYQKSDIISMAKDFKRNKKDVRLISCLESKRDKIVLEILLQAAEMDRKYENQRNPSKESTDNVEDTVVTKTSKIDLQAVDAVTLVRQNQKYLCYFLTQRLLREHQPLHEVLLQALLFYLHSATELHCSPETIIDIIIKSAENLNAILTSFYFQLKESDGKFDFEKLHGIQRHWKLLQKLIIACSGSDCESEAKDVTNGSYYGSVVPLSSWVHRISMFSISSFPLARFLGWMAVYHYAKQYLKGRLFLAFELCQLTSLLSIFSDDLAVIDNITNQKVVPSRSSICLTNHHKIESAHQDTSNVKDSFRLEHPDLHNFFPDMKSQFQTFGEIILEAVARQLKSLPSFDVSDTLCWLAEFCLSPSAIRKLESVSVADSLIFSKGFFGKNAKAIILYLLEAIISEHMEAMVPEIPRIAQLLVSLCKASYCDVAFLDSILRVLMPLISYALRKVTTGEDTLVSDYFRDYEAICFGELFDSIKCKKGFNDNFVEKMYHGPLTIFTLGTLLPYLSLPAKQDILQSLILWAYFTSEPSYLFFDYLSAFQRVVESSVQVIVHTLEELGIKVAEPETKLDGRSKLILDENLKHPSRNLENIQSSYPLSVVVGLLESNCGDAVQSSKGILHMSQAVIDDITKSLDAFFPKLYLAIEFCWELHFQLAQKLTVASSKCCMFRRCLASVRHLVSDTREHDTSDAVLSGSKHWKASLEGLTNDICSLQENNCWNVASAMIDYLLDLPETFPLDCVLANICTVLKNFCCYAPKISWRVQTDKWLSSLCTRNFTNVTDDIASLGDLFCTMLDHSEPEQRCIALQQLGRLLGMDINDKVTRMSYVAHQELYFHQSLSVPEVVVSSLVSSTWNNVASVASCDPLLSLRASAVVLLSGYIPFASRSQVQSFLVAADKTFPGTGACTYPVQVPALSVSLVLLACACVHSPSEDILLVPENVWSNLEKLVTSISVVGSFEKKLCHALSELRAEPDAGREELREIILSGCAVKQGNKEFSSTRESILEVVSSLTSVESYFDFFSRKVDQEALELEEAEIELKFLHRERALVEFSERSHEVAPTISNFPCKMSDFSKDDDQLSKIKIEIQNLEKTRVKEEISARRQKKLIQRRMRQNFLEEASLREMELLQELDRERTTELQREIERQRLLELERAKTKELRYNLDLEREKQIQKELQRELEQAESGVQTSKQEFSSNPNGRARERYRGRESGRSGHEGNVRSSSRVDGSSTPATSSATVSTLAQGVLLVNSRSFPNQTPTILQSRDVSVELSTSLEDSFDGSRDSGDTGSVGEPDTGSAFEGAIGSTIRQGTRGSRSRQQVVDRREREVRREGKWEKKQHS